ncbi:MAG: hypothetical protein ABUS48_04055 [Pseudomonadota bacterium]
MRNALCRRTFLLTALSSASISFGGNANAEAIASLRRHPFLLTGEWDHRNAEQTIFLVRHGRVAWTYTVPNTNPDGGGNELGDATLLPNGNVLFARKTGAGEVTPDRRLVWNIDAPARAEIHTLQPIGGDRVMVMQNGNPAKLMIIHKPSGAVEKTLILPVPHSDQPHIQFRRVRLTPSGTYLAGHLDDHKIVEYDQNGVAIWTQVINRPWGLQRLANGNTLTSCYDAENTATQVVEISPAGEIVWQFTQADAPDFRCYQFQGVKRLANGNTIICNWCAGDLQDTAAWSGTVQVFEVTREKAIVWALSQWGQDARSPDLGTASSIQLLDQPGGYGVSA